MAYKIFLDTNIFLDHFMERNEDSTEVLNYCQRGTIKGYASSASFFTLAYFLEKSKLEAKQLLKQYGEFIEVIPTFHDNVLSAYSSSFSDLGDAFQYFTTLNNKDLDFFIAQNMNDYKSALHKLEVISPYAFLKKLMK